MEWTQQEREMGNEADWKQIVIGIDTVIGADLIGVMMKGSNETPMLILLGLVECLLPDWFLSDFGSFCIPWSVYTF